MVEDENSIPNWVYAKQGLNMCINNEPELAEIMFKKRLDSLQVSVAYSYLAFMNAVISFDEDSIQEANKILRDVEKRSTADGWMKTIRDRLFVGRSTQSHAEILEKQIILADTQICIALLTFLQQDFSGFMKGAWILRRAWKIYQSTYKKVYTVYKRIFKDLDESLLPAAPDYTTPEIPAVDPAISATVESVIPPTIEPILSATLDPVTIQSDSRASNRLLNLISTQDTPSLSESIPDVTEDLINSESYIEPSTLARLMSAISFGYGVFHLCVSLLPANFLRIVQFFGFEGDRDVGITSLMYARKGDDMRAPLATLALLCYHTVVKPFYALDGVYVDPGVESASLLIEESERDYERSAYFLYFKGRLERLKCNNEDAIINFQAANEVSNHREMRTLCLHEIGWSYLLKRDFVNADITFTTLSQTSRWSKSFYGFVALICRRSYGNFNGSPDPKDDIITILQNSRHTAFDQAAEIYIIHRVNKFPTPRDANLSNEIYWRMYIYEMLMLWNVLTNCSTTEINNIINDCKISARLSEPICGLSQLVLGACYCKLKEWDNAINPYRESIRQRSEPPYNNFAADDSHISVFARYELAMVLLQKAEKVEEAKQLLLEARLYKDYDFNDVLFARIQSALKKINLTQQQ